MKKLLNKLTKAKIEYEINSNFKKYSHIKLDQALSIVIKPHKIKELVNVIKYLMKNKIPFSFIGKGTNSFIIDDIALISLMYLPKINKSFFDKITVSNNQTMDYLASYYAKRKIKTFIGGTKIPGTIGAGVLINAGLKNINITKYLDYIIVFDINTLKLKRLKANKCLFSYRKSNLDDCVILKLIYKKSKDDLALNFYHYLANYRKNQPKGLSLGSTFKNQSNIYAGKLLDFYGLKNVKYKDFRISSEHANFIIANGKGTAVDFYLFLLIIKIIIYLKANIVLEAEISKPKIYFKT